MDKGKEKPMVGNLMTKKFGDMKDFPFVQKIGILEPRAVILEDSLFTNDEQVHTSTLKCCSHKGTLFLM